MKKKYIFVLIALFSAILLSFIESVIYSTLSVPDVQSIYGGRINHINGYQFHTDSTRVFVATESANSVFYADMYTTTTGTPSVSDFQVVPSLDNTQNFGSNINNIQIHENSENIYFIKDNQLYTTNITATSVTDTGISGVNVIFIKGDDVFIEQGGNLNFGTIDASNNMTLGTGSPISAPSFSEPISFEVHPTTNNLYLFEKGTSPGLYVSSDVYSNFSGSTTFTDISPTLTTPSITWKAFGIAPDGRFFLGGDDNTDKYIAYSDDSGTTWTEYSMGVNGIAGPNFDFSGNSTSYYVYFATVVSNNNGVSGSWSTFGSSAFYTHPNDGFVYTDATNDAIVYMTTDQGLGISMDNGLTIISADAGIEAVQVNDMEMTSDKNTAWIASKSGIRRVTDYTTTPSWTNAIFPNNDGSPYFSVGMDPTNSDIAYVGNLRIYKTTDAGSTWTQVFTPEVSPYSYAQVGTSVNAITVCPYDTNIVFAGIEQSGTDKGGLFYSEDAGSTWSQLLLNASSGVEDVDVRDIVFTQESSIITAYVGVEYDLTTPTGRSIYKVSQSGSSWSVSQDMNGSTTSTGSVIVVTINDLEFESSNNTVYATGTDAGTNHPVVYNKPLSGTGLWTVNTVSGFPSSTGKVGKAITYGIDTLYCAVDNEVYYLPNSASSWVNGYTYPEGTRINSLFYDDLLVGTDTGLYSQIGPGSTASVNNNKEDNILSVYPNPVQKNNSIKILHNLSNKNYSIRLSDINGKMVKSYYNSEIINHNGYLEIKTPNVKSGIYFLEVFGNTKRMSTRKIIIE